MAVKLFTNLSTKSVGRLFRVFSSLVLFTILTVLTLSVAAHRHPSQRPSGFRRSPRPMSLYSGPFIRTMPSSGELPIHLRERWAKVKTVYYTSDRHWFYVKG